MNFIPLHIRSGYSFLKSGILLKNLFEYASKCGYDTLGITDLEVMYGIPEFNKLAKEYNIKPIFGMDIKIENYFFSLFIKNEDGYRNLCKICSLNNELKREGKETKFSDFSSYFKGLICVLPIHYNDIFKEINSNLVSELNAIKSYFEDIFVGLEIYQKEEIPHADLIRNFCELNQFEVIAYPYIRYLKKEDAIVINMLDAIRVNTTIDPNEEVKDSHFFFKTKEEIVKFYSPLELKNTTKVLDLVTFNFDNKRGSLINYVEPNKARETFINTINEGVVKRGIDLNNPSYKNRLNHEFNVIKNMGYINYFLVVQDYIKYAKRNSIPIGPGRGSAAGSLVSYCLEITDVDPIKYDLLFERFLNAKRNTMPDIDVDISDIKRDEVIKYLIDKYGKNHVARVAAYQTIAAKQALRDTGRVFGYPTPVIDELSKTIPNNFKDENAKNFSLDYAYKSIPAFKNIVDSTPDYKLIFDAAHRIEGLPRQRGLHAAGVVLNEDELSNIMPLDYEGDDIYVTEYEKDYLEDQGFLKMDLLGLSNLTVIEKCLEKIKETHQIDIKMEDIPYDDPIIFDLIKDFRTMGIFQLDTAASLNALANIKPDNFNEIVATISLDRPGPMQFIPNYSKRKEGKEKIVYLSKVLEPILKETYGIIVYQEQIMQIAQVFSGFTFAEADLFRRAISKKHHIELMEMKDKFIKSAVKRGHKANIATQLFDQIEKFANYGFNKSHAVSYAMIACKEAYLKAKYPLEFYASILDQQYGSNDVKFSKYLAEIKKSGLKVLLPDINESTLQFIAYKDALLIPLLGISGLQSRVVINILEERNRHGKFDSFINFVIRMTSQKEKITESQLSKLIDAGAFDNLESNRKSLKMSIPGAIQYASNCVYTEGQLFDNFGLTFSLVESIDDPVERIENEANALGVMISDSPLNYLGEEYKNINITKINNLKVNLNSTIVGIIRNVKTIVVKNGKDKGKPMAFVTLFDESGDMDCTFFTGIYAAYSIDLKPNQIIMVKGHMDIRNNRQSFLVNDCKIIRR